MTNKTTSLTQVQEHLDYFIILGGNWEQLRSLVMDEIGQALEKWEVNKEDAKWVLKNYIPWMKTLYEALRDIDAAIEAQVQEAEEPEEIFGTSVEDLIEDYKLTLSNLEPDEMSLADPFVYMDEYFNMVDMPAKRVVQEFLERFYTPGLVEEWLESYAWDEDEEQDPGPGDQANT